MVFEVRLSAAARRDIRRYLNRFKQWAPLAVDDWHVRLMESITSLSDMPRRCIIARESHHKPAEVRQLLFGAKPNLYRIVFTIRGQTVFVLRIRAPRESGERQALSARDQ